MIALSDEPMKEVAPYADKHELPFLVGAGSTSNNKWGVRGYPSTFVIAPDGTVAWEGHPSELTDAVVKKALKGAKKPKGGFLALRTPLETGVTPTRAHKLAEDGQLAAALKDAEATIADVKATPESQQAATAAKAAVVKHVDAIFARAEKLVSSRDVAQAIAVFETLAKEFVSGEYGDRAKKRLAEIRADAKLMSEIEAAKEYAKIKDGVKALGPSKSRPKFEALIKKYPGTKAADRAKAYLAS